MAIMSPKRPLSGGAQPSRSFALAALASAVLIASPVYAQQPPDAGRVLDTVKEPKPELKSAPEITIQPEAKPALKAKPGLKVKVTAFKITGSTVFPETALLPLVSDQIGKELDFEELNQTANKIAVHYRSKGYFLAQAYLPAQQISDGAVEIAVLEGRVGEVKLNMNEKARLRESRARGILGAIQPGDLINERSLERGLLLLNDTPGVIVKSTLQPGAKVGAADVAVDLSEDGKRVSGSIKADNWGSRFTGEYRVGADLNINNPSGFGDLISVTGLTSSGGGSPMGRLSYIVPVGPWGTKLGASYSKLNYTLGKDFESLKAHGTAEVGSIYMLHPFVRTRNFNVVGIVGADRKKLGDFVDFRNTTDDKRLRNYKAGLSGDYSDNAFGGSLNTFSLTFTGGNVDLLTALVKTTDQSASGYQTFGSFSKANYSYQRQQALPRNLSLFLSLDGQTASKNLVSSEQFSLGGPGAVRAYPVGEAVGDEGVVLNAELRWNVPQTPYMLNGFVDYGHSLLHKTPTSADINSPTFKNYRNLLGYGLGLNVGRQGSYLVRTSIAWRSDRKDGAPTADRDRTPRAWVQLTKWF